MTRIDQDCWARWATNGGGGLWAPGWRLREGKRRREKEERARKEEKEAGGLRHLSLLPRKKQGR